MKKLSIISLFLITAVAGIVGCGDADPKKPGSIYMPDMTYSRAYETYSANNIFPDNQTNRVPVEGTVAKGELLPFRIAQDAVGDTVNFGKARFVANPLPLPTEAALKEGERLYLINCGICHGAKLDGNGPLYNDGNGPYPAAPRNLLEELVVNQGDGQIFYTITYGKNMMGPHASLLTPKQRWEVIDYIRSKQDKPRSSN